MNLRIFILTVALGFASFSQAELNCHAVLLPGLSQSHAQFLRGRYGINPNSVELTPELKLPVIFRMNDGKSLAPEIPINHVPVRELKQYDVTIVGGGPAGLTAALYLAEAGKSVLILERNPELGGLAMGSELNGIRAGGGAAYSAGPKDKFQYEIFRKIGLGQYKKKISIAEPIDSYLWKGKLYEGIWEDHTLEHLPSSFSLFKHALLKLEKMGASDTESEMGKWADGMSMANLVREMPSLLMKWKDAKSKEILKSFNSDKELDIADPMKDVIELLDLYGRSALGGTADMISARQFIDFYGSELETRYTGSLGTGTIAEALIKKLKKYPELVHFRTEAPVAGIENQNQYAKTSFIEHGVLKEVVSNKVMFAAPITLAPKLIKDLKTQDPEKLKAISSIQMSDYAVHVVRVKGHPYRATYDTWVANNGDPSKPTDFILGRWQDPAVNAYDGMRNFETDPKDDFGVITIYQPLGLAQADQFDRQTQLARVEAAVEEMIQKLQPLTEEHRQKIEVELIESYRWPLSIHVVSPGYLQKIPVLERATGNIHFITNTVAAPELETAMARGAVEALKIIKSDKEKQKIAQ